MKCKFNKAKGCINTEFFVKWKDAKKETAWLTLWLTLSVCPECPIYIEGTASKSGAEK